VFPLIANQQRLGMIVTHTFEDGRLQQDEELQLLRAIVAQGAISIQNALLFSDVTRGRDRLAAVLNSVDEGILMIEAGGRIMIVNESIRDTTGLLPADLTGKRLIELPEQVLLILGYSLQDAEDLTISLENGRVPTEPKTTLKIMEIKPERVLERTSLPVWGRGSKVIGCIIVLRDVTEEHQIAEARELITETLVHDLRSPLSAVLGSLDVIEESTEDSQQSNTVISQALHVARRSSRRVLGMVESMLDISRMQSGGMEINLSEIDLYAQVSTLLADFIPQANEYGIILRNEISTDLPTVKVDQSKFIRVLTNLLDNALKFTPSGGQVTLSAEPYPENMVAVSVSDTGPGIPDGYREKIFERFTQIPGQSGRRRGSGLGLTFCRLAVEAHGGQIWVDSKDEDGSVFTLTLPAA
jgi:PAS domain S-box-containing protein